MNVLGLEAFLAVVQTRSLSKAAARLHLAQSTVSKRIQNLEESLGVVLFERGQGMKSVELTPLGESYVELAERWFELQQEMRIVKSGGPNPKLIIGTLDSANYALFPPLFRSLCLHEPRIQLQVVTIHSTESYEFVEKRRVDVAFSYLPISYPNVDSEVLFSEMMVGLCLEGSNIPADKEMHPRDLCPDHELYNRWHSNFQTWHEQWWDANLPNRVTLDTSQLIMSFFHNPRQWSIVPLSVARVALSKGGFKLFRVAGNPPDNVCYRLRHKNPKKSILQSLAVLDGYLATLVDDLYTTNAAFFATPPRTSS